MVFEGRIETGGSLLMLGREERVWGNGPVRTYWIGGGTKEQAAVRGSDEVVQLQIGSRTEDCNR